MPTVGLDPANAPLLTSWGPWQKGDGGPYEHKQGASETNNHFRRAAKATVAARAGAGYRRATNDHDEA